MATTHWRVQAAYSMTNIEEFHDVKAVARARDRHAERSGESIPIIADGSIAGPADAVLALALGADTVMLGNLLARYAESPGAVVRGRSGDSFKEYWMEGSLRAANARRYAQARSSFFEEGIEGWVPYEGSIYDGLPALARALRSAMATAGCGSIEDLHAHAVLEWQSQASLQDGAVRGMHANDV